MKLSTAYPYIGGKTSVANLVWQKFGEDISVYVEPFAGSLAMLINRPYPKKYEIVNDIDCLIVNFWRSVKYDPSEVADHINFPIAEAEWLARHKYFHSIRDDLANKILNDHEYYDAKIAGEWVWYQALVSNTAHTEISRKKFMPTYGTGVHRKSIESKREYIHLLHERTKELIIMCGDWERCVSSSLLRLKRTKKTAAIFLDPPYSGTVTRTRNGYYIYDNIDISSSVRNWAIAQGENSQLRIALCGHKDEHEMPSNWEVIAWKSAPNFGKGKGKNFERIWFSPHCFRNECHSLRLPKL